MSVGFIVEAPSLVGHDPVTGFGDSEFSVRFIHKSDGDKLVRRLHYSGSPVWSSSLHLGVFIGSDCIGVLQFGPPMNPAAASSVVRGSTPDQSLELNRMVFEERKPINCGSRAIAYAIRFIRRTRPKVEWIQSFADERCGKFGAVYQAAGFLYLGEHSTTFYRLDEEWFHKSLLGRKEYDKRGWRSGQKAMRLRGREADAIPHTFRQFRYFRPLTKWARTNLLLKSLPYPKPNSSNAGEGSA